MSRIPRPAVDPERRRRRSVLALAAAVPLIGAVGGVAGTASAAPAHASPLTTVTGGLNNPRHLHFMNGKLYVAEAGTGGNGPCAPGDGGPPACVGRTGDIAVVGVAGSTTRIMQGLSSVAPADGSGAAGPADVAFKGTNPVAIVQDTNIDSHGRNPFGPQGNDLGKLVAGLRNGSGPNVPGPDFAAYEAAHNPDHGRPTSGPGAEPPIDSDPYGITPYRGGFAVADAAGNDILWVNPQGVISTLAVLPTNHVTAPPCLGAPPGTQADIQAVPTSVRVGPDGALYVPELSGVAGSAKVLRVVPGQAPTVYAAGFDSITDLAFDSKGRLLVTSLTGGLYCGNGSGKLIRYDKHTNTKTPLSDVSFPTGVEVNGNRVYMSSNGASAAGGPNGGKIVTLVELD